MRCFQYVVTEYHSCEWWLMNPLIRKIAPNSRTTTPIQSPHDHDVRARLTRSPGHAAKPAANRKRRGITVSSPRTAGARADATSAAMIEPRDRTTSARAIRKKQSAAYG